MGTKQLTHQTPNSGAHLPSEQKQRKNLEKRLAKKEEKTERKIIRIKAGRVGVGAAKWETVRCQGESITEVADYTECRVTFVSLAIKWSVLHSRSKKR